MTVLELIRALEKCPPELEVIAWIEGPNDILEVTYPLELDRWHGEKDKLVVSLDLERVRDKVFVSYPIC